MTSIASHRSVCQSRLSIFRRFLYTIMTVDAPAHLKGRPLFGCEHTLNLSMAGLTFQHGFAIFVLCQNMHLVAESYKIRKVVDLHPLDGFIIVEHFFHLFDRLSARVNNLV